MVTMHCLYLIALWSASHAAPQRATDTVPWPPPVGPVAFEANVFMLTAPERAAMTGVTWHEDCPVELASLRRVQLMHWTHLGRAALGNLIVAEGAVEAVVAAMEAAYREGFPIEKMQPMVRYAGDDEASMNDNNTSAFNCRPTTGGGGWSAHALGLAIDINPRENPYVKGEVVLPPTGAAFVDRTQMAPGMLHASSALVTVLASHGWGWGGRWRSLKDYQHVSATGR